MTCSQDRFPLEIHRIHISKGFPLVASLAKPPLISSQSIRLSSHCFPQMPGQREEPLILSPHCSEWHLVAPSSCLTSAKSCSSSSAGAGFLQDPAGPGVKVQHSTAPGNAARAKAECCCWVWLKVLGWSPLKSPLGASDRTWQLPQCWLLQL